MKIDVIILQEYVRKISINNTISILNLNFTTEGITTSVKSPSNIAMTIALLKSSAFEDYEAIGELFIKNSKFLSDALKTFTGVVSLVKVEDHIIKIFNSEREVHIILADESICDNVHRGDSPAITSKAELLIHKKDISRIVNDMTLLKNANVTISIENKELIFQIGKKRSYDYIMNKMPCDSEETLSVTIGNLISSIVTGISDEFVMKPVRVA